MPGTVKERLLNLLRTRAVRRGEFVLSSGEKSTYYIDGRMVAVCPEGAALIGEAIYEQIKDLEIDAIGGLAVGAVPVVTGTMVICHQKGLNVEGFWVRDSVKGHGTKKLIEGKLPERVRVVVVDDVITSGDSVQKAIEAVEAVGGQIVKVITLVDRQRGAKERFEQAGYIYEPLFTKDDLIADESMPAAGR